MLDTAAIEALIVAHPAQSAEAWAAIRQGREGSIPSYAGLETIAQSKNAGIPEFWANIVVAFDLTTEFEAALQGQGVKTASEPEDIDLGGTLWPDGFDAFFRQTRAFRCRVWVNNNIKGSALLVGPSTVLTAWHVVAVAPPGSAQEPNPRIEVEFADGLRIEAGVPVRHRSQCTLLEFERNELPRSDADVVGLADVALLLLKDPVGLHVGFAKVSNASAKVSSRAAVAVVQYPNGEWKGLGFGQIEKLRNMTARWAHTVPTEPGSSGGGCFDTRFELMGIHQGLARRDRGRLVPASQFPPVILEQIALDEVPTSVWSLDGTPKSDLVVGREPFFIGFHAATRGAEAARGLWIKRTNVRDPSGLSFSYALLQSMVARSPETRVVRVTFDSVLADHPDEIARRVRDAGFAVKPVSAASGADLGQTEPEAVVADRSRRLAIAVDAAARDQKRRLWLFFDQPSVLFGDEPRWALTAFVDQALRLDNLRVAIAGYEGLQFAGAQFQSLYDAQEARAPGLMMEYLNGFTRYDLRTLIETAAKALGASPSLERVEELMQEALHDLPAEPNGRYGSSQAASISERLQPRLREFAAARPQSQPASVQGGTG